MEFPHGSHHHRHHHHDDEHREPYPAYPPPGANFSAPPPFQGQPYVPQSQSFDQVTHVHHTSSVPYPPPNPTVNHISEYAGVTHVSHQPHMASFYPHTHDKNRLPDNLAGLAGRPTVKVYSKADPNYYLTITHGKVILALADPSNLAQHWYMENKYSTRVKDTEGHPSFALVNKATGEALKHSVGATQAVQLTPYNPERFDESVLWTESKDMGEGFHTIRMVNNIRLNVDAYHGDPKSGGIHNGTPIVLWDWNKGINQLWKMIYF